MNEWIALGAPDERRLKKLLLKPGLCFRKSITTINHFETDT